MSTSNPNPESERRDDEQRFAVTFRGKVLGGIIWRTTRRGETIIKTLTRANAHLGLFVAGNRLHRHVTHERYPLGSKRRYTQKGSVRPEELALSMLAALAPEDDPPPEIKSFQNQVDFARLTEWFTRVFPRIFRKAQDRPIVRLKGPLQEILDRGLFGSIPPRMAFELEPVLAFYKDTGVAREEDAYIHLKETDLRPSGPRVGFTFGMRQMVICLADDMVLELDYDRIEDAAMKNFRIMGFDGLLRALRRKGSALFDESAIGSLRKFEGLEDAPPHFRRSEAAGKKLP